MREHITTINARNPELAESLLHYYQKNFPLVERPFLMMAEYLQSTETEVISMLEELAKNEILTRVGPVFDHKQAGASLLAAVSVPDDAKNEIALKINAFAEVNHNYARDHHYNLWFVVTAPDKDYLKDVLDRMETEIGYPVLRLPMVKSYHIDLGFRLSDKSPLEDSHSAEVSVSGKHLVDTKKLLGAFDQHHLRCMIQQGIPICERPFEQLAQKLSEKNGKRVVEEKIIHTLRYWQQTGLIKRFGLITNHYRLGYQSNAMVVWNIPDELIDLVGSQFKASGLVSLCYQRPRRLPEWPYNLFCMIHSKDKASTIACVEQLVSRYQLKQVPKEVLFTTQQFKQKGGVYTYRTALATEPKQMPASSINNLMLANASLSSPVYSAAGGDR